MKTLYTREEMLEFNIKSLKSRGITILGIADLAYKQQQKYSDSVTLEACEKSVKKILSLRDVFHLVQLGIAIDIAAEKDLLEGPIGEIMRQDTGAFGVDEIFGLSIAGNYGVIGQTNFGDIDVNKPGLVGKLDFEGKNTDKCHCMVDDIVGAIAAAAGTRESQKNFEGVAETQTITLK